MKNPVQKQFNVLLFNRHMNGEKEVYDVLPYFRNEWNQKGYAFDKVKVHDKKTLKEWILRASRYMYWARCEYEFLMASWPFGTRDMHDKVKDFFAKGKSLDDYGQRIDFDNIIIKDMYKIDVHEQIEMNIDIITDILAQEFKIDKLGQAYRLKHIPTGLYYRPSNGYSNLDTKGKIYTSNKNGLSGHKHAITLKITKRYEKYLKDDMNVAEGILRDGKYIFADLTEFKREYI